MVLRIPRFSFTTLFAIIPLYYFNSCTAEFIKQYSIVLPIVIASAVAWFIFMFAERALTDTKGLNSLILVGIYGFILLLLLMLGFQNKVSVLVSNFSNILFLLFFICVLIVYSNESKKNDRKLILFVWICDTVISCLYSIYRLIDEPFLSRYLSTGSFHQTAEGAKARGIISFAGVYGLVLILVVLLYLFINQRKERLLYTVLIVLFSSMIIIAQFTIAIFLLVVGFGIIIISNNSSKDNALVRAIKIIAIVLPLLIILPFFLRILANSEIFGYEVTARINEILNFLNGGELYGSDLLIRFSQYFKSIKAFWASFGLGSMWFDAIESGTHSELLDGFANYGVLYCLFAVAIFNLYKYVINRMKNNRAEKVYKIVFIVYIMISILNTSTWAPMTMILFVIIPFICLNKISDKNIGNTV